MAMVRWNPARDLMQMREEMDRLFSQFLRRGEAEEATWTQGVWTPPVDIFETDDAIILRTELPGLTKEDIEIELQENRLVLRGQRRDEALAANLPGSPTTDAPPPKDVRRERASGRFERSFLLPTTIDAEKIQTSLTKRGGQAETDCYYRG
jgi:HSP20 family protein